MSTTAAHDAAAAAYDDGLAFHAKGGPMLAVCGLAGGAGASTVALLVALAAARASTVPVMVCDTGGPNAGLAAYIGTETRLSLATASERMSRGEPFSRNDLMIDAAKGRLRIMASGPEIGVDGDELVAERLLNDARLAHGLTVVDCGTLTHPLERKAMSVATHVAWVLPATVSAAKRAERALRITPAPHGAELVIARYDAGERKPPMRALKAIADARGGPLVLLPHVPDMAETDRKDALEAAEVTLQALGGLLHR